MTRSADNRGGRGLSPREWEQRLLDALERADHAELRDVLLAMRGEMDGEVEALARLGRAPLIDRLTEQIRRLLGSDPTAAEALESELGEERRAWADFRRRYRDAFLPAELHPFLESCAVFIEPGAAGCQFPGFDKWSGRRTGARSEAVTLFHRSEGPVEAGYVPANFFTDYVTDRAELVVKRAYRTVLPRGAGLECILEHAQALIPATGALERLRFDNVQNSATYRAHVETTAGSPALRTGVGADDSPLGRLAARILSRLGYRVAGLEPRLDGFGILDLVVRVRGG